MAPLPSWLAGCGEHPGHLSLRHYYYILGSLAGGGKLGTLGADVITHRSLLESESDEIGGGMRLLISTITNFLGYYAFQLVLAVMQFIVNRSDLRVGTTSNIAREHRWQRDVTLHMGFGSK